MATTEDIKDAVFDELDAAMDSYLGGSATSHEHVRISNRYEDGPFPAYTFETFDTDINRGMGSGIQVHNVVRNADDTIDYITVRREKWLRVDIGAHTAGDDERSADQLYDYLEQQFTPLVEDVGLSTDELHSDVERLRLRGTTDVSGELDGVRGERFRIDVEYHRYIDITDVPTMASIDAEITVQYENGEVTFQTDTKT